ncbi:MAG: LacI family DNA-binding transcriptional regulator [Lentisphaerae bacterium]|nr:LacI family DNA-binding transcriptional regulator [Lentisphaerota bacterium]
MTVLEALQSEIRLKRAGDRLPPIRETARRLGVSPGTVQHALKHLAQQGLVEAHVGRGTFVAAPNGVQGLRRVTILRDDNPNPHEEVILRALQTAGSARRLHTLAMGFSDIEHAIDLVPSLAPSDAFVVRSFAGPFPVRLLERLRALSRAVVVADSRVSGIDVDVVSTDFHELVPAALDHLLALGHRDFLLVAAETMEYRAGWVDSFLRQLAWRGLPGGPERVVLAGAGSYSAAAAQTRSVIEARLAARDLPPFTGVVAANCPAAQGVLDACAGRGLDVPGDISVVAIDLPDLDARYTERLTMVGRNSARIAETIYACIESRWARPDAPYSVRREPPELVVRNTTAPPRRGGEHARP